MVTPRQQGRFIPLAVVRQKHQSLNRDQFMRLWFHLARINALIRIDAAMEREGIPPDMWTRIANAAEGMITRQGNHGRPAA